MIHDTRLFEALEASRPTARPATRIGPDRPAIAPLAMMSLGTLSVGLWVAIAYVAHLI